ncbi:MAG TPA: glutamate 5-kinase [Trueperaceae bacterium]
MPLYGRTHRRLVVKVGTSSLTDDAGRLEPRAFQGIAAGALTLAAAAGAPGRPADVVVVSSGAGAAGRERLNVKLPLTLPQKQAAAAVGQALLMNAWAAAWAPRPVAQLLLSAYDVQTRRRYVNAKNALEATLALGAVPVINENDSVATSELKVGDNDTLSAWVAYLVGAELLVILTDVDGLYEADPRVTPSARRLSVVSDVGSVRHAAGGAGSAGGTGGMGTKLAAARIAADAGIETVVLGGGGAGLEALARSGDVGTRFLAGAGVPARKAWILNQPVAGTLLVDEGARDAVLAGRSLLPKGIVGVDGEFAFGDAVSMRCGGEEFAVGLTNYSAGDLRRVAGRHTREVPALLGAHHYEEAVHRDNLVLGRAHAGGTIVSP